MLKISGIQNYSRTTNYKSNTNMTFTSKNQLDSEMRKVAIVLESAKNQNGGDRFKPEEISQITNKFMWHNSEIDKPEFMKALLKIGSTKGTPLTSEEIGAVVESTRRLDKKGHNKVLVFTKHLKEKTYHECNAAYIQSNYTYEKFKKIYGGAMPEEQLKEFYKQHLNTEIATANYYARQNLLVQKAPKMDKLLSADNFEFVNFGIAKCSDPGVLAEIVLRTGINGALTQKAEPLINLYKMGNRNIEPVLDFERCFSANDIENIMLILEKRQENGLEKYKSVTYHKVYDNYVPKDINMRDARQVVLKKLNLQGKIKLENPLEYYVDMMDRGRRIGGSYEQGKRR